jgi:hypothetical protein
MKRDAFGLPHAISGDVQQQARGQVGTCLGSHVHGSPTCHWCRLYEMAGNQSPQFNKTLTRCPVCDFEVYEEYLPLHIEVNHPLPRDRWWLRMLRWLVATQTIACGGAPFYLSDNFDAQAPITTEDPTDATPQTESAAAKINEQDAAPAITVASLRDVPDAQGSPGDSGSVRAMADGYSDSDTSVTVADASTEEAAEAQSGRMEASVEACPPAPVAPDGFSNICATSPARGSSIIQTFPGECACNWTCECLMTSSVCQGLGAPSSCQVVNGPTCNSVVVAVVICK